MSIFHRTPKYQQTLYNQIIDEQQPGTILQDFETIITFMQENVPLKVTETAKLPSMKLLPDLNARLVHSIEVNLKRPQHISFPNIMGLYLLLRANGIAFIGGSKKQARLMIDEEILTSWQNLNPTERYFTLLETVLLRADPQIVAHRDNNPLYTWHNFFQRFPKDGLDVAGNKQNQDKLDYFPGYYNLALMQMFGLIEIEDTAPELKKGWHILRIEITSLGKAIYEILNERYLLLSKYWCDKDARRTAEFGILQSEFQTFFPEWINNLEIPIFEPQPGTYIFKISVWNDVWRRLAIPGNTTLETISNAILKTFNFTDHYHLYRYIYTDRFGIEQHIDHPELHIQPHEKRKGLFTDTVKLQEIPLRHCRSMIFYFDLSDQWHFEMELEEIAPVAPDITEPKLLDKKGEAPKQYE